MLTALVPSALEAQGRRIEVLFLGHESPHHASDPAANHILPLLARNGINLSYSRDPDVLNPQELAKYDALMLYANHDTITPSQEQALLDFVASGKGFLPIHSASFSFQNSPEYIEMVGGQFLEHGTGKFTVPITEPDHPVMEGILPFETWDETYVHHKHNPENRTVLMERIEGDEREPWTWVRDHGQGRVFYTAYGHNDSTWTKPEFQQMIRNAIIWSVGDEVRSEWEQLQLPELTYEESSYIPNYERRNPPPRLQRPLPAEASQQHMQFPPGFDLQLFAAEPDIVNPIAMTWDERGRLWLAETIDYPNNVLDGPGNDRIKILEDTDGDGRADKITVFADSLNIPTGLVFANGGLIVSQAPHFLFLKDTDGDDRADVKEIISSGWGVRDTHAGPSNLRYGFDNKVWGAVGYSSYEAVEDADTVRFGQAIYRMDRDGSDVEHVASFSNNTWGLGFSEEFEIFGSTANNTHAVFVGIPHRYTEGVQGLPQRFGSEKIDGHYAMRAITPNVRQVDVFNGFTAASGFELYTARAFPEQYWNRIAFVSEPTGGLVHQAILEKQGAGFVEEDGWNILASTDEWTGPVEARVGPDGALWVADWYDFIIQHNPTPPGFENGEGNAHVNPLRDDARGRIYRLVYNDAPDYQPMELSQDRPAELVQALQNDNLFWRLTAQRLLVERGQDDVAPELYRLVQNRQADEMGMNPGALHALWTLHGLGLLDGSNIQATQVATEALSHPAAAVRKTAVQVLPETEATHRAIQEAGLFQDPDPRTRLAAVLTLTQLPESEQVGQMLYGIGKEPGVQNDPWLANAVYVAAAAHRPGYLQAYADELGPQGYQATAQRLADEIRTASNDDQPRMPERRQRGEEAEPAPPVAERLLRAYVEEVVGPIARPEENEQNRFGDEEAGEVAVINMSIIPGEMKFTLPNFTVQPRQPVRLEVENPDDMPHNLLILRPGTLEAVGALADAMVAMPDAAERHYVPATPDVIWYTPLINPEESYTLEFRAPRDSGDYPYVCTFPGHWRIMVGVMQVVE